MGPGDEAESKRLAGKDIWDFDGGTLETYHRMVEQMDGQVGRVIAALAASGLAENTIVIFTSDSGGERFSDTCDAAYPSDGMNLLPALIQDRPAASRKLFWHYKANAQRAARDGDFKVLKIRDQTFLFNVPDDPLERANLKERRRDVYNRMTTDWDAWNATMLPEVRESATRSISSAELADHYGASSATGDVDDVSAWPNPHKSN